MGQKHPNPPTEQMYLMRLLDRIHVLHHIHMFRNEASSGLYPGQPPVLHYIKNHPGCTQKEVAEALQVSTPSIANSVKRMQKSGLLDKQTDENDLRRSHLTITEKGCSILQQCDISMREIDAAAFEDISSEDMAVFRRCLEKITENLTPEEYRSKNFFSLLAAFKEMGQHPKDE